MRHVLSRRTEGGDVHTWNKTRCREPSPSRHAPPRTGLLDDARGLLVNQRKLLRTSSLPVQECVTTRRAEGLHQ